MADTAATPSAPTETILSDTSTEDVDFSERPAGDQPAGEQQAQGEQPAEKEKPPLSEAEKTVLNLLSKTKKLEGKERHLQKRELALKSVEEENQGYRELIGLAKTDPLGFLAKIGEHAGLAYEDVVDAVTAQRSGGEAKLPADHATKALQAELADLKAKLADKETKQTEEQKAAAGQQALQGYLTSLKGAAAAAPDEFPLFNAEPEANAIEAFDLMAAMHAGGKPITHAEAVRRIEEVLRETTEKRAAVLGFQRAASSTTTHETFRPTSPTPTKPAAAPRAVAASAAPDVPATAIRSDEDIRNDWLRSFPG